jgi:hypothetical protein
VFPDDLMTIVDAVVPDLRRRGLAVARPPGVTLRRRLGLAEPASRWEGVAHG